jgi:hypothetical protein
LPAKLLTIAEEAILTVCVSETLYTGITVLVAELSSTRRRTVCTGIVDTNLLTIAEQLIITGGVVNAFYTAIAVLETELLWLARSQSSNAGTVGCTDLRLAELRVVAVRVCKALDTLIAGLVAALTVWTRGRRIAALRVERLGVVDTAVLGAEEAISAVESRQHKLVVN